MKKKPSGPDERGWEELRCGIDSGFADAYHRVNAAEGITQGELDQMDG